MDNSYRGRSASLCAATKTAWADEALHAGRLRRATRLLLTICLAISGGHAGALAPPGALAAVDAAAHIGETATVCGLVAGAKYATEVRGEPTFLDIDKPYPRPVFTAVIWGENRAAFGTPEVSLLQKRICVKGAIESYRGRPEIILRDPKQLSIQ